MLKLFSGSAHPKLSAEVAQQLGIPISNSEVVRFGNSEVKVTIKENVKYESCAVIQPTTNPTDTNLIELCFFCDALRRSEAKRVVGIVPYFGYAKQNIQHRDGECVSVNVIIKLMESIGFSKVYAFDLHDEATAGVFTIPFKNLSAFQLLADHLKGFFSENKVPPEDIVFVSPDQGAVEKVRHFGTYFYGTEDFHEAVIEKKRDQNVAHRAKPIDLYGDVKDKIAVIVDDMVVSGSTVAPAVDLCLERGAREVYAAVVHHDFTEAAPKIMQNTKLKKFFTTNTIPLKESEKFPKLVEVSVAKLIADELR